MGKQLPTDEGADGDTKPDWVFWEMVTTEQFGVTVDTSSVSYEKRVQAM